MAVPLTSECVPAAAALIDGVVALVREAEDSAASGGMAAAGGGKGKRAEYRCAACGYGIVVHGRLPSCPMCHEARWQHVEWRPFSQLLDLALPVGTRSQRRRLDAPSSPTAAEPIRYLRPGQARAAPEK